MANKLTVWFKENRKDMFWYGIIGAGVYLLSKKVFPSDMSTLQASFGAGVLDKVVNLEIQTLILFIVIGMTFGIILTYVIKKKI